MDILMCVCIILVLLVIHTVWPKYVYDPLGGLPIAVLGDDLRAGDMLLMKNCVKCKYTDNVLDNGWQFFYRNTFDSFRWYLTDQHYTHVAIILRINNSPYICHMDGGPMYDALLGAYIKGTSVVVSPLSHQDERGGVFHLYRYTGPELPDAAAWVAKNRGTTYPSRTTLAKVNALKWGVNPPGVMACTDFVEHTMRHFGIDAKVPSNQSTISDVFDAVRSNPMYEHVPARVLNKCRHF